MLKLNGKLLISNFNSISTSRTAVESILVPKNMSVLDAPIPNDEQLPDIDDVIKKRLQVVKQPLNDLDEGFSDRGIGERLANLKGMPYKEHDNKNFLNAIDQRTEQEKANDLIARYVQEASLDKQFEDDDNDPIKIIERRLAALKGPTDPSTSMEKKNSIDNSNELVDEKELCQKIVTKVCFFSLMCFGK